MNQRTPEQLFASYRDRGDAQALGAVFDALAPELLLVAMHLASGSVAEDLVQATFLDAIRLADRWDQSRPLAPWLVGILANHAREARRQQRRAPDPARLPVREVEGPDELVAAEELAQAVHAAVEALPLTYRQVLSLRIVHGLELPAIAHALSLPLGTVKTKVHRGTALLRRALPAGLAGTVAALVTTGRSLAAVRSIVMEHALPVAATATGGAIPVVAVLGGLVMNKIALGLAAVAVAAGGWFALRSWWSASIDVPRVDVQATLVAETTTAQAQREVPARPPAVDEGDATTARTPVATTGSLALTSVWASDGATAPALEFSCIQRITGRSAQTVTTDAAGRAVVTDLTAGDYRIVSRAARPSSIDVTVVAGECTEARIAVDGDLRLTCTVVDVAGTPQAGAEVWRIGFREADTPQRSLGRTDSSGVLRHRCLPLAGVWARKVGCQPSRSKQLPRGAIGDHEVHLVLGDAGCILRGTVLDPRGQPLANATVAVAQDMSAANSQAAERKEAILTGTGTDGRFVCDELPNGELAVAALADGFAPSLANVTMRRDRATEVTLQVLVGATVEGRAVHRDGHALAGATVVATADQSLGFGFASIGQHSISTVVDVDGNFRLVSLRPGSVYLDLSTTTNLRTRRTMVLGDGEVAQWNVTLPVGGSIAGRVVDAEDHALGGVLVQLTGSRWQGPWGGSDSGMALADADGRFKIEGLDDAEYAVRAFDPGALGAARQVWLGAVYDVHPGTDDVLLRVPSRPGKPAAITGRVVWPTASERLDLMLYPKEHGSAGFSVPQERVAPGTETFRIGPLPPGEYDLRCEREGAAQFSYVGIRLAAGQTYELPTLHLDWQHAVLVRLSDRDHRPATGAAVVVQTDGGPMPCTATATAGEYRTLLLMPGRYALTARSADFALLATDLDVSTDPEQVVALTVAPAAKLVVRVRPAQRDVGQWVGLLKVLVTDVSGCKLLDDYVRIDTAEPFFDLPLGLAPGSYSLHVSGFPSGGSGDLALTAEAADAAPRRVELQLR